MYRIERKKFFDYLRFRLFNGYSQEQVDGLSAILDIQEQIYQIEPAQLAYVLATAHHETGKRFKAIEEYGKGRGKNYGIPHTNGKVYYGRGLVQLTWYFNYSKMEKFLQVPLYSNPELALDLKISVHILFAGMINGLFTGKRLDDYIFEDVQNFHDARRVVTYGLDKPDLIAGYAKIYLEAIEQAKITTRSEKAYAEALDDFFKKFTNDLFSLLESDPAFPTERRTNSDEVSAIFKDRCLSLIYPESLERY